jgi:hypothetical protein
MTESYPIRPITPDEFDQFHLVDQHAFHGAPLTAEQRPKILSRLEFDRTLAAFDGSTPVGIAAAFSFRLRLRRGLPGRDAPRRPRRRGPGHPAPRRQARTAVRRHGLGSRPVVPRSLLTCF